MKTPQKIRISKEGFETYTGYLGPVHFTNAVSDDVVPFHIVNRIAASMPVVYVEDDGAETPAGAQVTLMENLTTRAAEHDERARQSDEERSKEERARILKGEKPPVQTFYTKDELEKVGDNGIKELRKLAEPWGVKNKSIPGLIVEILEAQAAYIKDRDQRREAVGLKTAAEEEFEASVVPGAETAEPTEGQPSSTLAAAIAAAQQVSLADAVNAEMRNLETEAAQKAEADAAEAKARFDAEVAAAAQAERDAAIAAAGEAQGDADFTAPNDETTSTETPAAE